MSSFLNEHGLMHVGFLFLRVCEGLGISKHVLNFENHETHLLNAMIKISGIFSATL
jgi:hypothetical protein